MKLFNVRLSQLIPSCLALMIYLTGCGNSGSDYQELTDSSQTTPVEQVSDTEPLEVPVMNEDTEPTVSKEAQVVQEQTQSIPAPVATTPAASKGAQEEKLVAVGPPPAPPMPEEAEQKQVAVISETSLVKEPAPAESVEKQLARMRAKMLGQPEPTGEVGPPREIKLLIPDKEFDLDPKRKALRVTFDDIDLLKVLNMDPVPVNVVDYMPDWLSELNGKRIVLRGWMYPAGRADGITRFMYVRDSGLCCFGSNPKIYDKLAVTMSEGETTKYIQGRPFDVVATLKIEPDVLDGELFFLYHLEDASVIDE